MTDPTKLLPAALLFAAALSGCAANNKAAVAMPPITAGKSAAIVADEDPYIKLREKQRIAREKSLARDEANTKKLIAEKIAARKKTSATRADTGTPEADPAKNPLSTQTR